MKSRIVNLCFTLVDSPEREGCLLELFAGPAGSWRGVGELFGSDDLGLQEIFVAWLPSPTETKDYRFVLFYGLDSGKTISATVNYGRLRRIYGLEVESGAETDSETSLLAEEKS